MGKYFIFIFVSFLSLHGCMRAGFSPYDSQVQVPFDSIQHPQDDNQGVQHSDGAHANDTSPSGDGTADAPWNSSDLNSSKFVLNKQHDRCETALPIDLKTQQLPLVINMNTAGSTRDYDYAMCKDAFDLVVRFENFTGKLKVTCAGGGMICQQTPATNDVCPGSGGLMSAIYCDPNKDGVINISPPATYVIFYREASAGPVSILIEQQR